MPRCFRWSALLLAGAGTALGLLGCGDATITTDTDVDYGSPAPTTPAPFPTVHHILSTVPTAPSIRPNPTPPSVPFPAAHPSMPLIPDHGGVVLHDPSIVTITFPNDPMEAALQAFGDTIGQLQWWQVTSEYGVGPARSGGNVTIATDPPAAMTDADIVNWLYTQVSNGTLPAPTDQTIFAVYFQDATTVSLSATETSCNNFLGYHDYFDMTVNGEDTLVAYAVIDRCGGTQDQTTFTASHEFAEAVTDPHPSNLVDSAQGLTYMLTTPSAWTELGGEVGDMCAGVSGTTEAGYALTRVWSNEGAKAGNQPCVPVPVTKGALPYFNGGIEHDSLTLKAGESVTTPVDCYSFGPLPNAMSLPVQVNSMQYLSIAFDRPTCSNGDVVQMTLTLAPGAPSGTSFHYTLEPQVDANDAHLWRGMVTTP